MLGDPPECKLQGQGSVCLSCSVPTHKGPNSWSASPHGQEGCGVAGEKSGQRAVPEPQLCNLLASRLRTGCLVFFLIREAGLTLKAH